MTGAVEGRGLEDGRWSTAAGGYRIPYDPRPALRILDDGGDAEAAWRELATNSITRATSARPRTPPFRMS